MTGTFRRLAASAGLALGAVLAAAPAVQAQETGWQAQVTPYVWAAGVGGDITPFTGAPTLAFSTSFSEVLEDLDAAFFVSGFARKDRFVLLGDFSYSSTSRAGLAPPGVPAEGRLRQTSLTLAAGYRAVTGPDWTLDVLGGARLWSIRSSVEILGGAISASPGRDFIDPIVALRANVALAPRWSALVYADVGGAGSRSTSQVLATVNYQIRDTLYVSGGFRTLNVDYVSGGTEVDATMSGPILGVTWRF